MKRLVLSRAIDRRCLPLLALPLLAAPASGATVEIDWGTSFVLERVIQSDGSAITPYDGDATWGPNEFKIELGAFAVGFTPTVANLEDWVANWQVFDAITVPDADIADGFSSGAGETASFAGNATLLDGQTSDSEDYVAGTFPAGTQSYVFIRNRDTVGTGAEWILYTNESGAEPWTFPDTTAVPAPTPRSWDLVDADTAVVGAINGPDSLGGGTNSVGGGTYDTSGPTDYIIRTHNVASLPEPSPALSLLFGLSIIGLTRRR
ncbi:MAG: hypothetical protein HKO57_05585 [Akkermansiaceae bacterium]|nr:hypothetical protein [Akkermansiaceae bacterium]